MALKPRILIVENSPSHQEFLRDTLKDSAALKFANSAEEACMKIDKGDINLIILNTDLGPETLAIEFCSAEYADSIPIVVLSKSSDVHKKVRFYNVDVADFFKFPLDPIEFKARVESILRVCSKSNTILNFETYRVDLNLQKIYELDEVGEFKSLDLTPMEYKLLCYFLMHEGDVLARDELLKIFWGDNLNVSKHTLNTHISSLRKKIRDGRVVIRTVFKKGFCLSSRTII